MSSSVLKDNGVRGSGAEGRTCSKVDDNGSKCKTAPMSGKPLCEKNFLMSKDKKERGSDSESTPGISETSFRRTPGRREREREGDGPSPVIKSEETEEETFVMSEDETTVWRTSGNKFLNKRVLICAGDGGLPNPAATGTEGYAGTVFCWLPAHESNFYDDNSAFAPLWRVRFDDMSLSVQDVEEHECIAAIERYEKHQNPPPRPRAEPAPQRRDRDPSSTTLQQLVPAVIPVGAPVFYKDHQGKISADGNIIWDGRSFPNPSSFSRACGAGKDMSGWRFVRWQGKPLSDHRSTFERNMRSKEKDNNNAARGSLERGGPRQVPRYCHTPTCTLYNKKQLVGPATKKCPGGCGGYVELEQAPPDVLSPAPAPPVLTVPQDASAYKGKGKVGGGQSGGEERDKDVARGATPKSVSRAKGSGASSSAQAPPPARAGKGRPSMDAQTLARMAKSGSEDEGYGADVGGDAQEPWLTKGSPYIGQRVRTNLFEHETKTGHVDGTVMRWLPVELADFVSEHTLKNEALWRVRYDTAEVGEEDLEEFEVVEAIDLMRRETGPEWVGRRLCRVFKGYGELVGQVQAYEHELADKEPFTVRYPLGIEERLSWQEVQWSAVVGRNAQAGAAEGLATCAECVDPYTRVDEGEDAHAHGTNVLNRQLCDLLRTPAVFEMNQLIECEDDGQYYPARVSGIDRDRDGGKVRVHFLGWNSRHDQWMDIRSLRLRLPVTQGGAGSTLFAPGMLPPTVRTMEDIQNFMKNVEKGDNKPQRNRQAAAKVLETREGSGRRDKDKDSSNAAVEDSAPTASTASRLILNSAGLQVPSSKCEVSVSLVARPLFGVPLSAQSDASALLRGWAAAPPPRGAHSTCLAAIADEAARLACTSQQQALDNPPLRSQRPSSRTPQGADKDKAGSSSKDAAVVDVAERERADKGETPSRKGETPGRSAKRGRTESPPGGSASSSKRPKGGERGSRGTTPSASENDQVPRPKKAARSRPSLSWDVGATAQEYTVGTKVEVLLDSGEWSEARVANGPCSKGRYAGEFLVEFAPGDSVWLKLPNSHVRVAAN